MATLLFQCEKCRKENKSLSSPMTSGVEIKLSWWCKFCQQINGVIYTYKSNGETMFLRRFKPFINSPMPTVDTDAEAPLASEEDVSHLIRT
jgi:hypothetical protein